jgi:pilus assembly protein CpaB
VSNKTKIIFLILAGLVLVVVGVFASMLLVENYTTDQSPAQVEVETIKIPVVILTKDLSLGDRISASDVQVANVPEEIPPRNAITTLEEAIGKMVKTDMVQGEMVLSHNLAEPTTNNNDLNYILSDHHVLMAFPATDLMSREGMVQRGDFVDIFATFEQVIEPKVEGITSEAGQTEEVVNPEFRTYTIDTMQKVSITAMVLDVVQDQQAITASLGGGQENETKPASNIKSYLLALDPQSALVLKHLKDIGAIFDIVLRSPTSTLEFELSAKSGRCRTVIPG